MFEELDAEIAQALADLRQARIERDHSSNNETLLCVAITEERLNRKLQRRHDLKALNTLVSPT